MQASCDHHCKQKHIPIPAPFVVFPYSYDVAFSECHRIRIIQYAFFFYGLGFELWQVIIKVHLDQAIKIKLSLDSIQDRISFSEPCPFSSLFVT